MHCKIIFDNYITISDKISKGMWLFFPLGLLLIINLVVFVSIVYTMCRLEDHENMSNTKPRKTMNK